MPINALEVGTKADMVYACELHIIYLVYSQPSVNRSTESGLCRGLFGDIMRVLQTSYIRIASKRKTHQGAKHLYSRKCTKRESRVTNSSIRANAQNAKAAIQIRMQCVLIRNYSHSYHQFEFAVKAASQKQCQFANVKCQKQAALAWLPPPCCARPSGLWPHSQTVSFEFARGFSPIPTRRRIGWRYR